MSVRLRGPEALALLALLSCFPGCDCGKTPLKPTNACVGVSGLQAGKNDACTASTDCGEHFSCNDVKGQQGLKCCLFVDRTCATESDCCEGQTCPADRKKCFDKYDDCSNDAGCGDLGDRFCQVYTDTYGTSARCRFKTCEADGRCPTGQFCFQGECMANLPCNGTCPAGSACVPSTGQCQDYSKPTNRADAACPVSCAPGFIGTFKDPRNLWDTCDLPSVRCTCAELPPITSQDLGRYSAIAADPGHAIYVSHYDGQYGDLVVSRFALDGGLLSLDYVDGLPTSGAATFSPNGPRKGVTDPGPDVGRYTSIAAGGGRVYVSYYDVDHGDLKVAVRAADGTWSTHTVDGASADVGRASAIALDLGGKPAVAYYQLGGEPTFKASDCPAPAPSGPTKYISALKLARASTATPSSAADWAVTTLACQARTPPLCEGCGGACANPGTGAGCFPLSTACTACSSTQVCVGTGTLPDGGVAASCAAKVTPAQLQAIPEGVGGFVSLAFKDSTAVLAFLRRGPVTTDAGVVVDGDLMATSVLDTGAVAPFTVIDAADDTGYFPQLRVDPTTKALAISYQDNTTKAVKYWTAPTLQAGLASEVVDTGLDATGGPAQVGADSTIVFTPSGVWALYQDSTNGDLKLAKRTSQWARAAAVSSTGSVGWFAHAVTSDGKVYVSHARLHSRPFKQDFVPDNTLLLETLAP